MRCATCAAGLLVYVVTATVLELYWMSTQQRAALVPVATAEMPMPWVQPAALQPEASQRVALQPEALVPPPTWPSPPPPSPSPAASPAPPKNRKRKGKRKATADESLKLPLAESGLIAPIASKAGAPGSKRRWEGGCWPMPRPFFEPPFDEALA